MNISITYQFYSGDFRNIVFLSVDPKLEIYPPGVFKKDILLAMLKENTWRRIYFQLSRKLSMLDCGWHAHIFRVSTSKCFLCKNYSIFQLMWLGDGSSKQRVMFQFMLHRFFMRKRKRKIWLLYLKSLLNRRVATNAITTPDNLTRTVRRKGYKVPLAYEKYDSVMTFLFMFSCIVL